MTSKHTKKQIHILEKEYDALKKRYTEKEKESRINEVMTVIIVLTFAVIIVYLYCRCGGC